MRRVRGIIGVGAAVLAAWEPARADDRQPMEFHMAIQADIARDADLETLPSVLIEPILAAVPLDDRLDADEAFGRPFVEALREGLTWYLGQRGLRVVERQADLRLVGVIDGYEGDRGWGDWGVNLRLALKIMRGGESVVREPISSLLKYADDDDVEDEVEPRYRGRGEAPRFVTILFTRVGLDLGEKIIALLRDSPALRGARGAAASEGSGPRETPVGRGLLSVSATQPHAEVLLDGRLVGTTPIEDLPLPAGSHTIVVRRKGYRDWTREVLILDGGKTRLMAELEAGATGS
jgi:hypothetical protein